jgi:hypothetical protein
MTFINHFTPGARGDFLASVLMDSWCPIDNGAVHNPCYTKLHYLEFLDQQKHLHKWQVTNFYTDNNIKIRIEHNENINNIMQITYNFCSKCKVDLSAFNNSVLEHRYTWTKNFILKDRQEKHRQIKYDHTIDFSLVNKLDILRQLYRKIHQRELDNDFAEAIQHNINQQQDWTTDPLLVKLSSLIEFELKLDLLTHYKSFDINEFFNSNNSQEFLTLDNYSKNP